MGDAHEWECVVAARDPNPAQDDKIGIVTAKCAWWWQQVDSEGQLGALVLSRLSVGDFLDDAQVLTVPGLRAELGVGVGADATAVWLLQDGEGGEAAASWHAIEDCPAARLLLREVLSTHRWQREQKEASRSEILMFLTSSVGGFVAQSESLAQRLATCPRVKESFSFLRACDEVVGHLVASGVVRSVHDVAAALRAGVGGVVLDNKKSHDRHHSNSAKDSNNSRNFANERHNLMDDLSVYVSGLALPLLERAPPRRRVAFVTNEQDLSVSRYLWETAAGLGVSCVIFSARVWWPDDAPDAHLREACLLLDTTSSFNDDDDDDPLWRRIVRAVQAYPHPIDALLTPEDEYTLDTANAARVLGLASTHDPAAMALATNKGRTADLLDPDGEDHILLRTPAGLDRAIASGRPLPLPAVCKPVIGRGSEGVFLARDQSTLRAAITRTFAAATGFDQVLIQPYVDGPEVDANLVILDGKLLFSEVVDDFPKPGDLLRNSGRIGDKDDDVFTETLTMNPSKLPLKEQQLVVSTMLEIITKQGFSTGIFHCEARVRDSQMAYAYPPSSASSSSSSQTWLPDLQQVTPLAQDTATRDCSAASVFLHEINPRLPGPVSCIRTFLGHGVDYWCLSI